MDFIFQVDAAQRASCFHRIFHSFGCTYISLWSYHTSNCLVSIDGFYREDNSHASSSSGSLGRRLFDQYRQLNIAVRNDHIPGLAFMSRQPFMELEALQLQRLASAEAQLQFYREARIQVAVFMGCNAGEVELGMSYDIQVSQVNLETEMRNLYRLESSQQAPPARELPHPAQDQNWATSSSSSSLRSLSPELSPFLLNIPSTSYLPEPPKEAHPVPPLNPTPSSIAPLHQAMQAFGQIRNVHLPNPEAEEAAITQAILAVLSCSSPPNSSSSSSHQIITPPNMPLHNRTSKNLANAFKRYNRSEFAPSHHADRTIRRQNMFKRSLAFSRTLNLMRTQERAQGKPSSTSQSHHVMSERKRREKLNQSFQELRSLLPPGTKKDKASVLAVTTEYLASLRAQVAELCQRNQSLETRLSPENELAENQLVGHEPSTERLREKQLMGEPSNESPSVQLTQAQDSTSDALVMSLQVIMKEGQSSLLDLVITVLEFLKQVKKVSLLSVEGDTMAVDSSSMNRGIFVLKIEGGEWDESAFQEAVRRVVADLAR